MLQPLQVCCFWWARAVTLPRRWAGWFQKVQAQPTYCKIFFPQGSRWLQEELFAMLTGSPAPGAMCPPTRKDWKSPKFWMNFTTFWVHPPTTVKSADMCAERQYLSRYVSGLTDLRYNQYSPIACMRALCVMRHIGLKSFYIMASAGKRYVFWGGLPTHHVCKSPAAHLPPLSGHRLRCGISYADGGRHSDDSQDGHQRGRLRGCLAPKGRE